MVGGWLLGGVVITGSWLFYINAAAVGVTIHRIEVNASGGSGLAGAIEFNTGALLIMAFYAINLAVASIFKCTYFSEHVWVYPVVLATITPAL
ncbi:hypothetical protein QNH14_08390 [Apirhabdus apintestini]|nr:hypothetical protein QNH14_08390 [Enterobacteriaceae bacterium CA-0114]